LKDVSDLGATLTVEGSIQGLSLKEFFLLLSSTGLAYRRCELDCINGDKIAVNFLKQRNKQKKSRGPLTFSSGGAGAQGGAEGRGEAPFRRPALWRPRPEITPRRGNRLLFSVGLLQLLEDLTSFLF
jgi:hypothetical protein